MSTQCTYIVDFTYIIYQIRIKDAIYAHYIYMVYNTHSPSPVKRMSGMERAWFGLVFVCLVWCRGK